MSNLNNNTTQLEALLAKVNALPEAGGGGGVELPDLNNEASATDLLIGKELINSDGSVVTGTMPDNGTILQTMDGINTKSITIPSGYTSGGSVSLDNTIDNEVSEQTDLITQIKNVVDNLPEAGGSSGGGDIATCTVEITSDDNMMARHMFTIFENSQISNFYKMDYNGSVDVPLIVNNVVCNSFCYIQGAYNFTGFSSNHCELHRCGSNEAVIKITANAGETATIHMYNND